MDFQPTFTRRAHRKRFEKLQGEEFAIRQTMYPCRDTMRTLGIREEVVSLLQRIGWMGWLNGRWPTYPALVMEFFASLEIFEVDGEPTTISFQLLNEYREFSRDKLEDMWNCGNLGDWMPFNFDSAGFWGMIAADAPADIRHFDSGNLKDSSIDNPVFRYIQRCMGVSIAGRHESGKVRVPELYAIFCMLNEKKYSLGTLVMEFWKHQLRAKKGNIWSGGLVTPIAEFMGIDLSQFEEVDEGCLGVSTAVLTRMKMIKPRDRGWNLIMSNGDKFPLPNQQLTRVVDFDYRDNWFMATPAHMRLMTGGRGGPANSRLRHRPLIRPDQSVPHPPTDGDDDGDEDEDDDDGDDGGDGDEMIPDQPEGDDVPHQTGGPTFQPLGESSSTGVDLAAVYQFMQQQATLFAAETSLQTNFRRDVTARLDTIEDQMRRLLLGQPSSSSQPPPAARRRLPAWSTDTHMEDPSDGEE